VPCRDLRDYLKKLERENQLIRFSEPVSPEPDIRAIGRAAMDLGESTGPAVLIDNILGYKGKVVVLNVHGSWANYAISMDMPKTATLKEMFYELAGRWDRCPGEVSWVKNAPCQEIKITDNINLYEILPLFRINPYDGGFYLSKASVVTKDPDDPDSFDKENVGVYRLQVQGPDTIGMQGLPFHDIGIHIRKAEELNQPLPVAICLGLDPMLTVMSCTPLAYDQSEYKFAAALNGTPEKLTKALSCDLDVPEGAEYVIEGEVIPRQRFPEGPFGEFPGSYSGVRSQVRIKVKAVTHRQDPILEQLYIGRPWTEHDTLIGLATSVPLYRQLRETMPEVTAVNAIYQHGLSVIIAVDNRFGGYAKSVAMRLASTPHGISYAKNIIVVDGDVDPFDLNQVMWALSTRLRAAKDVIIIQNTPGMPLDPSSEPPGMGNKLIIDATTPAAPDQIIREVKMISKVEKAIEFKQALIELQQKL
jgi:UbiD family decarboxylase